MLIKFLRAIADRSPTFVMRFFFNLYPPYWGAGISVDEISSDYRYLRASLKLRFYNRNYVGTQFGGSIFSMTDPHFMYLLLNSLGSQFVVWDQAAKIEFLKPGKTHLTAEFRIDESLLMQIKDETKDGKKFTVTLPVDVFDLNQQIIARVEKTIYIRHKKAKT